MILHTGAIVTPATVLAACLTLLPLLAFAFFYERIVVWTSTLSLTTRLLLPGLLVVPYLIVVIASGTLRLPWLLLYALLPIAVALLFDYATRIDPQQRGAWPDYLILLILGLAVDLRWFEPAWPPHLAVFNKMLLLDTGLWGFFAVRRLHGAGFDLRLRPFDLRTGSINFLLYTPIAIVLGLALGFLHTHAILPRPLAAIEAFVFTFFFIAVPEELFFRGWMQNLLERRLGRTPSLLLTSVLFGLSHFNKRALHFNWRYVLLAAIAGIFYGRAWLGDGRQNRRVAASAFTHTCVDTVWSLWLR